ncbi:hypothetical protein Tco_1157882 [Tanacetum coccineum]
MVWRGTSLRYETGEKKVNEHEKEDELVAVVVKVVHELDCMMVVKEIENGLLEEVEKLEWWFEQDIDDEGEEDEEDGGGDEV